MKKTISLVLVLVLGLATEVANADFTFGTPTNPGPPINSSYDEFGVCISANGLEFYFSSSRPGGYGGIDLWVMKRPTIEDNWGDPENLGSPANTQYSYWEPSISSDGLSLYFSDGHMTPDGSGPSYGNHLPGGLGGQSDIWMITRETIHDTWGAPVNIGLAVNRLNAVHPSISADGLSLYFQSHRGIQCDIMVATRESTSDSFGNPVILKNVNNNNMNGWMPDISADGRVLFYNGIQRLWMSTRATIYDDFGPTQILPPQINISSHSSYGPSISPDGSILYFASARPGGIGNDDIWQVSIEPIVDFNGDGIVDVKDIVIITEHWGENYPLCDIGPTPLGDGIIDIQDLLVLTEYIEPIDRTLIAHWALDETEGDIALDSVSENNGYCDGYVMGDPVWQPAGGQVDGAIQLDGLDDFVIVSPILNPAEGPFSILAWIRGGAPGQVVLSQMGGVNWLSTDPLDGKLMTGLVPPPVGQFITQPMESESFITDGQWHRIGFVWDGSYRHLYVDGVEVAKDAAPLSSLESSSNGLYIGAGKDMAPGTYFSGLIDDVRIYNRVVSP
jgi:hypothetical protein